MKKVLGLVALMGCLVSRAEARVSSPGNVTFSNPTGLTTTAVFDSTGTFVIQFASTDNVLTSTKTVTVTVTAPAPPAVANIGVGVASAISGCGIDVAVVLSTGALDVSSLQFDIMLPAGVTFNTATAGPAAIAAGKSVSPNPIAGGVRILVFGVNQTSFGPGQVVLVNLRLDVALTTGIRSLPIAGIVGSDALGASVSMTGTNGSVNVTANKTPVVSIGPNQTILLPATASLTATATDDGAPNPPSSLTNGWSVL